MRNFFALSAWLLATIPLVGSTGDIGFSPPNTNSEEVVNIDDVRDRRHLIVGGEDVDIGEYPYFVCGGALIAPDMVLTAAHCGDDCDDCLVGGTAFVGAYQFNSTLGGAQVRTCVDFVKHPDFINSDLTDENRTDYFDNDFGLCKLNEPVYIDESTVTLELNEDSTVPSGGDEVVAIGLGFESFFDLLFFQLANITQDVTLPVAPDCSGSPYFEDPLYKLCAGGLNQGLCAGDSGGPLVKISGGVHTHVGSGSLSYNCHSFGDEPAVFARTSAGVEWIKSAICDLGSVSESCVTESPTVSPTTKKEKKGKSGKKGKEAKDTKSKKSKAKKSKDKKSKDKKSKSR